MAIAVAPFSDVLISYVNRGITLICLVLEVWAFVSCLTQRAEAFTVVGRIPKGGWLAMIGGALLVTLLFGTLGSILGMIAVVVALIYLLDLRPALRDAVDGRGSW
jgi:Protein of unknown function (DUF2516)